MNRHPPSSFGDEPPAYGDEAASFLSHDDSPTAPSRHNGPSMRLLPTSSNVDSDLSGSYRPISPSQYSHYQSEYAETTSPYVSTYLLLSFPTTCNASLFLDTFQLLPTTTQSYPLCSLPTPPLTEADGTDQCLVSYQRMVLIIGRGLFLLVAQSMLSSHKHDHILVYHRCTAPSLLGNNPVTFLSSWI